MTVEERLERLERQHRWWRRLGAAGTAAVAFVLLAGQGDAKPVVVEANAFVLRDAQGRKRGELSLFGPVTPALRLFDEAGECEAGLLGGPATQLHLAKAATHVTLSVGKGGKPFFSWDRRKPLKVEGAPPVSKPILALGMREDGDFAILQLFDRDGRLVWSTPASK